MTADLTVRVSTRDDMARLDALFARSYPRLLKADYPPSVLVTALPLISKAQPALVTSGTFYVAETAAEGILGAGGWTWRRDGQGGDIRHVVTDDRFTRRGVGRALLQHVFTQARAAGAERLVCQSTFTAEPFYAALGFEARGRIEVPLRPGIGFPAVLMERAL